MIVRTQECFGIRPQWLAGDTAYGSTPNLNWLIKMQGIAPHVPVIDKSERKDGTFSREDFTYDEARDCYVCPAGKTLTTTGRIRTDDSLAYLASSRDCKHCPLKPNCCPKTPERKVTRSIYEPARDVARALSKTEAFVQSRRDRKKVEMLFAHLKRILRLDRLRLRGPSGGAVRVHAGGNRSEPAQARQACGSPAAGYSRGALCVSAVLTSAHQSAAAKAEGAGRLVWPRTSIKWATFQIRLLQQNRPRADICGAAKWPLFDHLVGGGE